MPNFFDSFAGHQLLGILPQILGFRESTWGLGNFPSNLGIFMGRGQEILKIIVNCNFKPLNEYCQLR